MKNVARIVAVCCAISQIAWSDPAAIMGTGNIDENETFANINPKLAILQSNGVKIIRLANSGYYDQYGSNGTSEKRLDSAMIWCARAGITPTILFEYYPNYPYPINTKAQWKVANGFSFFVIYSKGKRVLLIVASRDISDPCLRSVTTHDTSSPDCPTIVTTHDLNTLVSKT